MQFVVHIPAVKVIAVSGGGGEGHIVTLLVFAASGDAAAALGAYIYPHAAVLGRGREVCGTISGVTFVLSALYGDRPKSEVYAMVQQVAKGFQAETGSLVCRVLLGLDPNVKPTPQAEPRTEGYYKKRPCAELCALAADLLEDYLKNIT